MLGRKAEARSLLNRLIPSSPFMRLQPAILALAASGTEGSSWQVYASNVDYFTSINRFIG
jgi:hypothetical protein